MTIEQIIISLSYFGIFFLMTSNGVTSFPSSQILYIVAGYFAFEGNLNLVYIILIGALGHSLGNYILYEIARKKGLHYSTKFIKFFFRLSNPEKIIKKFQIAFNKKSILFLFIGKLANPSKIFIPIPAGIVKMNRLIYIIIIYITSIIWASVFTFIGYYFGKSYSNFGYIGAFMLILFIIISVYFYKFMNSEEIIEAVENKTNNENLKKNSKKKSTKNKKR